MNEAGKYTILIAEDEGINFLYLQKLLTTAVKSCNILRAKNGQEAVEICSNDKTIDLILMDIKMPVMNGFEATKKIKAFNPEVPVVAQTAYSSDEDKNKAKTAGCNDFISKPINVDALYAVVDKFVLKKV